jgi:hypothetical protein
MTVIPSFEEEEKINKKDKLSKEVPTRGNKKVSYET